MKNIGLHVRMLKFDTVWKNIGTQVNALNFGVVRCRVVMRGKFWHTGVHTKFSIARCGLRVHA
jgi:hypothetical protein